MQQEFNVGILRKIAIVRHAAPLCLACGDGTRLLLALSIMTKQARPCRRAASNLHLLVREGALTK